MFLNIGSFHIIRKKQWAESTWRNIQEGICGKKRVIEDEIIHNVTKKGEGWGCKSERKREREREGEREREREKKERKRGREERERERIGKEREKETEVGKRE